MLSSQISQILRRTSPTTKNRLIMNSNMMLVRTFSLKSTLMRRTRTTFLCHSKLYPKVTKTTQYPQKSSTKKSTTWIIETRYLSRISFSIMIILYLKKRNMSCTIMMYYEYTENTGY